MFIESYGEFSNPEDLLTAIEELKSSQEPGSVVINLKGHLPIKINYDNSFITFEVNNIIYTTPEEALLMSWRG